MTEKSHTKKMRQRYSWRLNIDKNLRAPCKVLANASGKEVRVLVSEMLQEQIANFKPIIEDATRIGI